MINAGQAKIPFSTVRISVVDASGKKVFDELIKTDDEGGDDLNTPFFDIRPEDHATHAVLVPLESVRRTLNGPISADTILIGHVLDNDLCVPYLVHRRVVGTATLFSHPRGPPHGRALRDLTKEHLNRSIQQGGASKGHSSMEDSVASHDLVKIKLFILNKETKPTILTNGQCRWWWWQWYRWWYWWWRREDEGAGIWPI